MGEKLLLSSRQLIQIKLVPVPTSFPAKNHDWNNKAICQKKQIDNYQHNLENISDLNISFMPLYFDQSLNNCVLNANKKGETWASIRFDLQHGIHRNTNWQNNKNDKLPT